MIDDDDDDDDDNDDDDDVPCIEPRNRYVAIGLPSRAWRLLVSSTGEVLAVRRITLSIMLLALPAGCSNDPGGGMHDADAGVDGGAPVPAGPRLIAPLSMSTVTQQKPTLRWVPGTAQGMPVVDLCKDRGCTMPLAISTVLAGDQLSAAPAAALPAGWVFWRVRVVSGTQMVSSATWQFWVGKASATTPVDTSNGAVLDVNGDGYPDLLVGAYGASGGIGTVHLYLGSATASASGWNGSSATARIDLTSPDGAGAAFGYAVTSAGDVNGDGYADFVVGAYGAGTSSGAAHLYLGSATPGASSWSGANAPARIDLAGFDGDGATFGASVAGVGDVNGDGYADFLIGASKAGMAHLYLGSATPSATGWSAFPPTARIDLAAPILASAFGNAVAGAGDVNGDGFADFAIGADAAGSGAGAVHVYFGAAAPSADAWNMATTAARLDLTNPDGANASFGSSVASAGDVNRDGYADLLVGARSASANAGAAHLYLGSATPSTASWNTAPTGRIDLTNPDGAGAVFGASVASAGDVNGDGYTDFLVGAEGAAASAGVAHLYLGAANPGVTIWNGVAAASRINLADPDGAGARFGASVAIAGDVNGDGYVDFLVGADQANALGGASQLYLGSAMPSATAWITTGRIDLTNPAGASARFGISVASAETAVRLAGPWGLGG